jgi:ABC-type glycerol-3-phosphate transport system substrate-binding protein
MISMQPTLLDKSGYRLKIRIPSIKTAQAVILVCLLLFVTGCDSIPPILPHTPTPPSPTLSNDSERGSATLAPAASSTATLPQFSQIEIEAEDLRGVIVRFWHPWTGSLGKAANLLVEQFNLDNPWGILVTAVPQAGYDALSSDLLDSSQTVDVPQIAVGYLHQALAWDDRLGLVDLRAYVADPEWGFSSIEQADFYPLFWEQDVVEGRRLGIPGFRSATLLYYNQTWGKELGFPLPPATPEQFRQQSCAAAQANRRDDSTDNDGTGGWIVSTDYDVALSWIQAFGGQVLRSPEPGLGQSVYHFNEPETEQAFNYLRELYDSGCAWQTQEQVPDEAFASRLGLFATGSVIDIPYQAEAFKRLSSQDQWTVLPFPSPSLNPAIDVYGPSYYLVSASPERQLAAWLFIRWLASPENNARLVETSGAIPVRVASLMHLSAYSSRYPQWAEAVELLKYAHSEPAYQSWGQVRRALGDANTQVFRSYFTIDQLPAMLEYLDNFAAELHLGPDLEDVFATPSLTPIPGARPTRTPAPSPTASPPASDST